MIEALTTRPKLQRGEIRVQPYFEKMLGIRNRYREVHPPPKADTTEQSNHLNSYR
jgi:hypothetical protein